MRTPLFNWILPRLGLKCFQWITPYEETCQSKTLPNPFLHSVNIIQYVTTISLLLITQWGRVNQLSLVKGFFHHTFFSILCNTLLYALMTKATISQQSFKFCECGTMSQSASRHSTETGVITTDIPCFEQYYSTLCITFGCSCTIPVMNYCYILYHTDTTIVQNSFGSEPLVQLLFSHTVISNLRYLQIRLRIRNTWHI